MISQSAVIDHARKLFRADKIGRKQFEAIVARSKQLNSMSCSTYDCIAKHVLVGLPPHIQRTFKPICNQIPVEIRPTQPERLGARR